jgi:hypothetical protein
LKKKLQAHKVQHAHEAQHGATSELLKQAHKAQHEFDLHKLQSAVSETNLSTELAELRKNYARMEELHKMEVRVVRGHGKEWVIDDYCFSIPFHTICSHD